MGKERGSILILTTISVLVLSLLMTGLLTVGTTELHTTQNFYLNKSAYYTALEGIEEIRNTISEGSDDVIPAEITKNLSDNAARENFKDGYREFNNLGIDRSYMTGDLKDLKDNTPRNLDSLGKSDPEFGFKIPPPPGLSLSLMSSSEPPVVWNIHITSEIKMGNRVGYAEVIAGIYDFSPGGNAGEGYK
ncbi:MAG: hypothetical protein GY950_31530 [bacterium]|nr:hypothetical protein [bacterium]